MTSPIIDEEFTPFYRDPRWQEIAPLLKEFFEHRVYGLLGDVELHRGYVALGHFKNYTLADSLAREMGRLCSDLLLNQMIRDGDLEVDKRHFEGREFPVSIVRKAR